MDTGFLVLAIPASFAFVAIVTHAVTMRGWKTALGFFVALIGFGFLRGNLVHIITKGRPPYSFGMGFLTVGKTGLVEAMGWCIALYLSWCLAERLLWNRKPHEDNLLVQLLFACAMMMGFAILMEAAAGRMDWWHWKPPKGFRSSPAFRDIERGITEWFSVGFDFLTPWLLFTSARFKHRAWALLGLIPFPFHFGMHQIRRIAWSEHGIRWSQSALTGEHLVKVNHLSHFVMLAVAVMLPYLLVVARKDSPDYSGGNKDPRGIWFARLDLVGLAIVVTTVCVGLAVVAGEWELSVFALPLALTAVYAWRRSEKPRLKA